MATGRGRPAIPGANDERSGVSSASAQRLKGRLVRPFCCASLSRPPGKSTSFLKRALLSLLAAPAALASACALAQQPAAPAKAPEVTVTATRVERESFDLP